jgi:crotonobetainyl-CoA:carnitine CoA-transferase CaiB-like acyl-CoA transferase
MKIGDVAHPERSHFGKPLDGVRVLALEQQQALPYATQLMARLGADVVKVELPGQGESGRTTLPAMDDPWGRSVGCTYLRNNLGKRSVCIDLKSDEGRDLILRLAPHFDVVAENFRGGTMQRLRLGYDDIAAVHPKVIYVSVSGFGNTTATPYAGWSAYAPIAEAMASLYEFKRPPDVAPVPSPLGAIGDTGTALFAAFGILAALRHRDRMGEGQYVDIALYDSMVAMADAGINYWSMGIANALDVPTINHAFKASDGYFVMMCGRVAHFRALATAIGRPQWIDDVRLSGPAEWLAHVDDILRPAIEEWASTRTRHEVCRELGAAGVAVGPVHTPGDVIADEHVKAHNMIVEMPRTDGVAEPILTPGNPVKMSKVAEGPETRVPWLGEHTDEVLGAELDLDPAELARLRATNIIS